MGNILKFKIKTVMSLMEYLNILFYIYVYIFDYILYYIL